MTITGKNFGSSSVQSDKPSVYFTDVPFTGSNLTCPVVSYDDTSIVCMQPKSNSSEAKTFAVQPSP